MWQMHFTCNFHEGIRRCVGMVRMLFWDILPVNLRYIVKDCSHSFTVPCYYCMSQRVCQRYASLFIRPTENPSSVVGMITMCTMIGWDILSPTRTIGAVDLWIRTFTRVVLVSHVLCALRGPASESHHLKNSSVFEGNEKDLCLGFILKLLDDIMTCRRHRAAQFICSHYFW